jgi:hypothetical protein
MVDDNLLQWYNTLPPSWQHRIVSINSDLVTDPMTAHSWPGEQHVYHDVSLATIVNDYRVCRIFCQRVLLGMVAWLGASAKEEYGAIEDNARFVIQRLVDEISAGVPFHMSYEMQPMAKELGLEKQGKLTFPSDSRCYH